MTRYLAAYVAAALVMAGLDFVWLSTAVKTVYAPAIGTLLAEHTNRAAAVLFYVLYIVGILLFAVAPALRCGSWMSALLMGAALGFFAYMTYDLTNMATLKVWPAHLAVLDIAWGTVLTGLAATAGYAAASRLA